MAHSEVASYWSRTCSDGRRYSHWREARPTAWVRIGREHRAMLVEQWPELIEGPKTSWVEWGVGGGANVAMLAEFAERVYGVDVSQSNLTECSRELRAADYHGFSPVMIDAGWPEGIRHKVPLVDGFLSTSTFQHFPSKRYTKRVVRLIRGMVRSGGYVFVQIRRDTPNDYADLAGLPYSERAMHATVYDTMAFGDLLTSVGISVEKVVDSPKGQYTYYWGRVE